MDSWILRTQRSGIGLALLCALTVAGCSTPAPPPGHARGDRAGASLLWPVSGPVISRFGHRRGARTHKGLDIRAATGTPVRAAASGRVRFSGRMRGFGNVVFLDHGDGLETVYAHHQVNLVERGARVARGEVIARSGATGNATTPHLHFEVRAKTRPRDPLRYLGAPPAL